MKNKQISLKAGAIIIATAGIFFLGSTLAILNATVGNKFNLFSGERERVNVGIVEKKTNGGDETTNDLETGEGQDYVLDSNEAVKEIMVHNINSKEYKTGNTLVRVRVVPSFVYKESNEEHKNQTVACDMNKLTITTTDIDHKWYELNNNAETLGEKYYYYSEFIKPGEQSKSLKFTANYDGEQPKGTYLVLEVLTEGVSYDDTDEVTYGWRYAQKAWGLSNDTITSIKNISDN